MTKVAGKGQLKFMIAGMGWATAELVMTRFVLLSSIIVFISKKLYLTLFQKSHFTIKHSSPNHQ